MKKFGILLCLLLGLTACGAGETYASLEEVREDIVFYDTEILKEVTFDDYTVFFVRKEYFGFRLFQLKKDGEYVEKEYSTMAPEGSVMSYEWNELFGDAYRIQFSVHDADANPLGMEDGKWTCVETGKHGKWHFSYEVLKQNDSGAYVPVEVQ